MNILNEKLNLSIFDELDLEIAEDNKKGLKNLESFIRNVGYSKGYKDESNKEICLSIEEQEEVLTDIYNNIFYSTANGCFLTFLEESFSATYLLETDMYVKITENMYRNTIVTAKILNEKNNKIETQTIELVNIKKALKHLKIDNQIERLDYKLDLFAESNSLVKEGTTLTIVKNNIGIKKPGFVKPEYREAALECIEDYKKHNKYNDLFIKLTVASMFTQDRKSSYFCFIVPSNFGKSFWMGAFRAIGLATECKFATLGASPGPISPEEVFGKPIVYEDEFKHFGKEAKEYTHSCDIIPKNKMRSRVDLFSKVMLCAEIPNSLKDHVDVQITNRITLFKFDGGKDLTKREKFIEHGADLYSLALQTYIYNMFKKEINKYKELGFLEASKQAAHLLKVTNTQYRISVNEDLMGYLKTYIKEKLTQLIAEPFSKKFNDKYGEYIYVSNLGKQDEYIYLSRPKDLFLLLVEESPNKNFKGTAQYKSDFMDFFVDGEYKNYYHPGIMTTKRCIKIKRENLRVVTEVIDNEDSGTIE